MTPDVKNLEVRFLGDASSLAAVITETEAQLTALNTKFDAMNAKQATATSRWSAAATSLDKVGKALMPVSLGIAAVGGFSIKMAADFNDAMTKVQTQAGATASEVENMKPKILALAPQVGEGPNALAQALFFAESGGFHAAAALDIVKLASEGAQISGANLADTTKSLVGVMNTNIEGAQNAAEAMGNLNAIVGAGMMTFQDLNGAIGTGFFAAAASFGVSLQSAGAALAAMTREGMPAEQAATRLRMTMTLMSEPTAKAQKDLEAAGFTMSDISTNSATMTDALSKAHVKTSEMAQDLQKPDGFNVAILDMKQHLEDAGIKGNDAAALISAAFGGGRTSGPILAMVQNTTALSDAFKSIQTNADKFGSDWKARTADATFKWDTFKATVQADGIVIGEQLLPKVTNAVKTVSNALQDVMGWWNHLSPTAKSAISDIAIALAVGGPLMVGLATVIRSIQTIGSAFMSLAGPLAKAAAFVAQWAATSTADILGVDLATKGLFTRIAAGAVMGTIVTAGAMADIYAVYQAVETVIGAINAMNQYKSDVRGTAAGDSKLIPELQRTLLNPNATPQERNSAQAALNNIQQEQANAAALNADGTDYFGGGLTWVGEEGPELLSLPRGSSILSNPESNQMASGGSVNLTVNVGVVAGNNVQDLAQVIYRELQRVARANGFNGSLPNIGVMPT